AGMEIGAVAEILEHMRRVGEKRLSHPCHAFGAHLRERVGAAIRHPRRHVMATNAAECATALGYLRRGVVGATRTIMRRALDAGTAQLQIALLVVEKLQTFLDRRSDEFIV